MRVILICWAILCAGCVEEDITLETSKPVKVEAETNRFTITRVNVFKDDLNVPNFYLKRGIYILKDNETGKEYVGISGIGISELVQQGEHLTER
jgi:hypothetical protein